MTNTNETGTYKRHRQKRTRDIKKRKKERRLERQTVIDPYLEKLNKK